MVNNAGLLLEGGGMRCAYTAGVIDFFLDNDIEFPVVATASAGTLIGSSYISKQRDRNFKILEELGSHPEETVSVLRMIRNKEIFGMDYIFDKIPRKIVPLDFNAFSKSSSKFIIGTTDVHTGKSIFFDQYDTKDDLFTVIRASSSLPVLAPSINYQGMELVDGGVSNPIPIQPLMEHGFKKHVVILTRNRGYVKKGTTLNWFFQRVFKDKPELVELLRTRHIKYNQTMEMLYEMEKNNQVFIIQPEKSLSASRFERNKGKLRDLYIEGYQEAKNKLPALQRFLTYEPSTVSHEKQESVSSLDLQLNIK